ncbi:hypothetical protein Lbir_2966 [Legionella birminghamensis]|uniref:Uncharacterized protein n=1 Tax=Legionella birminghamensis TaxID=28083 RepID=A0A378I8G5_9GAMM|nr:hypothetical protein [Legionella birminghamensis]KTC68364.1 hypothetical protein Lbir_2966 [Legionella birminghamensis]STX30921.1 Uncharacterised protein [Legionella birminghamensis]
MPYYVATVSAKWLKENTVIYSFAPVEDKPFSDQEMTHASVLDKNGENGNTGSPLKQVQGFFDLFCMYSAPISFPIAYRTFKKENAYLELSFDHPFSMRLGAYGDENQQFKEPLQLTLRENDHVEQVGIEGQETVTLHLLTIRDLGGDGILNLRRGAFFNNQRQVDSFNNQFGNLRAYFGSEIFRNYKIHICISEIGQEEYFKFDKNMLERLVKRYNAEDQHIEKVFQEVARITPAEQRQMLLDLSDRLRIPADEQNVSRENQTINQIRNRIVNYRTNHVGNIVGNYHQDILSDTVSYVFTGLSGTHSLAPDNSPWQLIVFPPGIGMSLIERHFRQTLNYSHQLIELAEQERIIPLVLHIPTPVFEKTFMAEIQTTTDFKNVRYAEKGDTYRVQFAEGILASAIDRNLPKTIEAIKNYKPNQPPSRWGAFFKAMVGWKDNEASPERTPSLNNNR